jgi:hypothetical protein
MKTFSFVNVRFQAVASLLLRTVRWLIACALCLLPSVTLGAQFTYTTNNGTITITGYSDLIVTNTAIVIPDSIDGMKVVGIGPHAFKYQPGLVSVTIPNGVSTIGEYAFYTSQSLTNINFPDGLVSIGDFAFESCPLKSITIPASVISIGVNAFSLCDRLESAEIGIGGTPSPIGTSIGGYAFGYCTGLKSVTMGDGVTDIGAFTFYLCSGLTNLVIPNAVTVLSSHVCDGCNRLSNVTIGNNEAMANGWRWWMPISRLIFWPKAARLCACRAIAWSG